MPNIKRAQNTFWIRQDKKQGDKDKVIKIINELDKKINKSTNKSRILQLKRMKKEAINQCKDLRETFVKLDDEKTKTLHKLLDIDSRLASGEIETNAQLKRERNKLLRR